MIDIKKSKILLLGAPGSGKGTLSSLLIDKYNLKHISTGNLFRNEVENNGEYASRIKELMVNGQLITDDITNQLAANSILEICNKGEGFILDGYPRTIPQAEFLSKIANLSPVLWAILLALSFIGTKREFRIFIMIFLWFSLKEVPFTTTNSSYNFWYHKVKKIAKKIPVVVK